MRLGDFDKDFRRAAPKLRRHYGKLGFKLMKGTPFMFLAPPSDPCLRPASSQPRPEARTLQKQSLPHSSGALGRHAA
jgi:hypothetical protein